MPNKICPHDFPAKLRKYWPIVQTMQTPIQAAWMLYYENEK